MMISPFSPTHYKILFVGIVLSIAVSLIVKKNPENRISYGIRLSLAGTMLLAYPFSVLCWRLAGGFPSVEYMVPLHLCDVTALICGFALLTRHPLLCELSYFWGFAGAGMALLTPSIPEQATLLTNLAFFLHHWGIIAIALVIYFSQHDWKEKHSLWFAGLRPLLFANLYFVLAIIANITLDANYGYLSRKPDASTLLDHLGPWPWYILGMQSISYLFFVLLSLPVRARTH